MPIEPLTALSVAAGTANKIYDMVNTIKDTPEEICKLRDEVDIVRSFVPGLLKALEEMADAQGRTAGLIPAQVQRLREQAEELDKTADGCIKRTFKKSNPRMLKKMQRLTIPNPAPWRDLATSFHAL
ncbi:hypothetical protein EIP86_000209 [Pleurotus ostreatoroseus]|nr:hypothetical protein EIP86_000209 [Pleurotus ostreatoroseus]